MEERFSAIVGLTGHAGHGKDTAGQYLRMRLEEEGLRPVLHAFADPLKKALAEMTGLSVETLDAYKRTGEALPGYGIPVRPVLQQLGDFVRERNPQWLLLRAKQSMRNAEQEAASLSGDPVHIWTDVRVPNEAAFLREHSRQVTIARVYQPEFDNGIGLAHTTESGVDQIEPDLWLENPAEHVIALYAQLEQEVVDRHIHPIDALVTSPSAGAL